MCGGGGGGKPAPKKAAAAPARGAAAPAVAPTPESTDTGAVESRKSRAQQARMQNGRNRDRFKVRLSVDRANVGGDGRSGLNIPSIRG